MIHNQIKTLIVVSSIITFTGALFTPFYVTYIQSIQGSFFFAGFSLGLFSILTGILIYFFGKVEIVFKNKRNLIVVGYAVRGLAFLFIGLSGSNTELLFGLIILSIGSAISLPAFDALYTRHVSRADSSVQWAELQSIAFIVTGFAALVGTLFIEKFGFREIFITLSALAFLVSIYLYRVKNLG